MVESIPEDSADAHQRKSQIFYSQNSLLERLERILVREHSVEVRRLRGKIVENTVLEIFGAKGVAAIFETNDVKGRFGTNDVEGIYVVDDVDGIYVADDVEGIYAVDDVDGIYAADDVG